MPDSAELQAVTTAPATCPVDHEAMAAVAMAADPAAACPVDHRALAAAAVAEPAACPVDHEALAAEALTADPGATCPVDHRALAAAAATAGGQCPVLRPFDLATMPAADRFVRRLLFIPDHPDRVRERDVQRLFSASITVSAVRCLLAYVLFPIIAPTVGAITKLGAFIGIPVGIIALVFDVRAVRRFWLANHKYRWAFTAIYAMVIVMVVALFARDIDHLVF